MSSENKIVWMVRSGEGSFLIEEFLKEGIVSVGWNEIGEIDPSLSYEEVKRKVFDEYQDDFSQGRINSSASQLWHFIHDFEIGQSVITYDSVERLYHVGTIESEYFFDSKYQYHNSRRVKWNITPVDRDSLTVDSKYSLGSTLTIFRINEVVWGEISKILKLEVVSEVPEPILPETPEIVKDELEIYKDDIIIKSQQFIQDKILKLNWEELELLVAGVLRSMGYKTRLTPKGKDRGKDILASPDGLEMTEPRIKVEVKHRQSKTDSDMIRSFLGGLRGNDKGLFVSTSGFSLEAKYEADRANYPLTLIDLSLLSELIVDNYESFDNETRGLIPLKKIYWPI